MAGEKIIGDFERGEYPSDGDISCDSMCGDGHTIRKGAPVFYKCTSTMYNEWRPVCRKHAIEETNFVY